MSDRKIQSVIGEVLTEAEVPAFLEDNYPLLVRSQKTLRNLRYTSPPSGPPFIIVRRRVFYPKECLHVWAKAQYSQLLASRRECGGAA